MKFIEGTGIDSYVAHLINEKDYTFRIENDGKRIINRLYNPIPPVFSFATKAKIIKRAGKEPSSEEALFSEYPDEDERILEKNYYMYDTINNIIMKLYSLKKLAMERLEPIYRNWKMEIVLVFMP